MSALISPSLGLGWQGFSAETGFTIVADYYHDLSNVLQSLNLQPVIGEAVAGWANEWWPTQGTVIGCGTGADCLYVPLQAGNMQWLDGWLTGANGRFGFAGIARDFNGNVLAGATIRCYRVSDGLPVAAPVTSDANGYFLITTPFSPDTHFLTVHKSGASPYAGASYDNLVGG